jgi:ribonuclease HI
MDLQVLQWNCNSLTANGGELRNYLSKSSEKYDVLCLEETHLKSDKNFDIAGYCVPIRLDRITQKCGGIATYIRQGLSYSVLSNCSNIEAVIVKIKTSGGYITIVNGYVAPNQDIIKEDFEKLFKNEPTIITGDFNAKNPLWGSPDQNERGIIIDELIDKHKFVVLNTGQPTRLHYTGTMSHLDISLASGRLSSKCTWGVLDNSFGSDHLPTFIKIGEKASCQNSTQSKFKLSTANWEVFKDNCRKLLTRSAVSKDVNVFQRDLSEAIIKAAEQSIKQTKPPSWRSRRTKTLPYWNDQIDEAIKARNQARIKMIATRDPADCDNYFKLKGLAQYTLKNAARDSWHNYCDTLQSTTRLSAVWAMSRKMNGIKANKNIPNLTQNGLEIDTNFKKAEYFANTFSKVSSDQNYSEKFKNHKKDIETNHRHLFQDDGPQVKNQHLNELFDFHEMVKAIKQAKKQSSPGKDRVVYEMLQHLPKTCLKILLKLYNQIWSTGIMPADFKHSIVIPIPKPNKNPHDPASYRPISLTNTIEKIMERLVTDRLAYHLEKNNLLNNVQTGFRKNKSTTDQILRLADEINRNIQNKRHTLAIFIDLEKAFDLLWRDGLLIKLKKMGISGAMFKWITDFMTDRSIQVRVNDALSNTKKLENGSPQGSPLSPLLFLVAINDLPEHVKGVETSLFADDCALYKSGNKIKTTLRSMQNNLDQIQKYADQWGFKISTNKTTCVLFTRNRQLKNELSPLSINNHPLKFENEAKFLGVIFDQRLTWKPHVDYIVKKCKSRLNLMRSVTGSYWGASRSSLITIYKMLIRSILDYGAVAYDSATEAVKKKLDSIQASALRIITGAMSSTAVSALQVETGEMPLSLRRQELQIKYATKIKSTPNHPATPVLTENWQTRSKKYKQGTEPLVVKTVDFFKQNSEIISEAPRLGTVPPWKLKKTKIDTTLSKEISKKDAIHVQKAAASEKIYQFRNQLTIYTDASCNENGKLACAYFIPELKLQYSARITDNATIYAAEMTAIISALNWLKKYESDSSKTDRVTIFTDSLSTLQTLQSAKSNCRPNLLIILQELLCDIMSDVTLVWLPGHVEIKAHDKVDQLAKLATKNSTVQLDIKLELKETYSQIENYITDKWQSRWTNCPTGKHYRNLEPKVSRKSKFSLPSRRKETVISRLRLGKCWLNAYLYELKVHKDGLCSACGQIETIQHYLLDCRHSLVKKALEKQCSILKLAPSIQNVLSKNALIDTIFNNLNRKI